MGAWKPWWQPWWQRGCCLLSCYRGWMWSLLKYRSAAHTQTLCVMNSPEHRTGVHKCISKGRVEKTGEVVHKQAMTMTKSAMKDSGTRTMKCIELATRLWDTEGKIQKETREDGRQVGRTIREQVWWDGGRACRKVILEQRQRVSDFKIKQERQDITWNVQT